VAAGWSGACCGGGERCTRGAVSHWLLKIFGAELDELANEARRLCWTLSSSQTQPAAQECEV
jgi:hypothetical protein